MVKCGGDCKRFTHPTCIDKEESYTVGLFCMSKMQLARSQES